MRSAPGTSSKSRQISRTSGSRCFRLFKMTNLIVVSQVVISKPGQYEHMGSPYRTCRHVWSCHSCSLYSQDAEMASLTNNPDAFKLYDVAVK